MTSIRYKANLSQFLRDLDIETKGPNSIYKRAGRELRNAVWYEFELLLDETPQWSGSTVASWRIGWLYDTPTEHVVLPERKLSEALQKGSEEAISLARMANSDFIMKEMDLLELVRQDIVVTNGSPQFDVAEYGPVRRVNAPAGAFERFAQRVADMKVLDGFKKEEIRQAVATTFQTLHNVTHSAVPVIFPNFMTVDPEHLTGSFVSVEINLVNEAEMVGIGQPDNVVVKGELIVSYLRPAGSGMTGAAAYTDMLLQNICNRQLSGVTYFGLRQARHTPHPGLAGVLNRIPFCV